MRAAMTVTNILTFRFISSRLLWFSLLLITPQGASVPQIVSEDNMDDLTDAQFAYTWIDEIPLSKQNGDITKDFSDGVLLAEIVKHYFPSMVQMHNYATTNRMKTKLENVHLLNRKVFVKIKLHLTDEVIRRVASCSPSVIEKVLLIIRTKINLTQHNLQKAHPPALPGHSSRLSKNKPEADQNMPSLPPSRIPKGKAAVPGASTNAGPYKGGAHKTQAS